MICCNVLLLCGIILAEGPVNANTPERTVETACTYWSNVTQRVHSSYAASEKTKEGYTSFLSYVKSQVDQSPTNMIDEVGVVFQNDENVVGVDGLMLDVIAGSVVQWGMEHGESNVVRNVLRRRIPECIGFVATEKYMAEESGGVMFLTFLQALSEGQFSLEMRGRIRNITRKLFPGKGIDANVVNEPRRLLEWFSHNRNRLEVNREYGISGNKPGSIQDEDRNYLFREIAETAKP